MPLYIGLHSSLKMPEDKIDEVWGKYKVSCGNSNIKAHTLYYNVSEGKAYCITEAASKDEVVKAHQQTTAKPNGELEVFEVKTKE